MYLTDFSMGSMQNVVDEIMVMVGCSVDEWMENRLCRVVCVKSSSASELQLRELRQEDSGIVFS